METEQEGGELVRGEAFSGSGGNLLQTSIGEDKRQAAVEGTGTTMPATMNIPGLDALAVTEFAGG